MPSPYLTALVRGPGGGDPVVGRVVGLNAFEPVGNQAVFVGVGLEDTATGLPIGPVNRVKQLADREFFWHKNHVYEQIDGVWTSGLGKSVVDAYTENGIDLVPIVGADNAGFVGYLGGGVEGLEGATVTNPGTVGGAGVTLALQILNGDAPDSQTVFVDPVLWANDTEEGRALIEANVNPNLDPLWPALTQIEGWTTYADEDLIACEGPA